MPDYNIKTDSQYAVIPNPDIDKLKRRLVKGYTTFLLRLQSGLWRM